jgi:pimeloyl-ACP methyl ester carboxylesterase
VTGLQGEFQMLRFDNRGIGKSVPCDGEISIEAMAADARALMDEAGWESAHVAGYSMGGVIAQQLALDYPKRVRSLALLCTFARGKDVNQHNLPFLWKAARTRIGTRRSRRRAFLEMLFEAEYIAAKGEEALAADVGRLVGRDIAEQPPIVMRQLKALGGHDASQRLGELAGMPALVVSGTRDVIARAWSGRRLAELISGARFELLTDGTHGATIEHVERVNEMLRTFWRAADAS